MIEDLVYQSGIPGLLIVSYLAATLLPLGSEAFVVGMALIGYNPLFIFFTATTGNTLGAITNYFVGKYGSRFILSRYINVEQEKQRNVELVFRKWGSPVLFFAWAPVVGDPLTVIAGGLNLKLSVFIFWVIFGKAFRYALIIFTTLSISA